LKGRIIDIKKLLGIALLLVVLGGVAMTVPPDREPDNMLENRFGDVAWNHERHARMNAISNCTVCHHTERQGAMDLKPCRDCHQPLPNGESLITPELFTTVAAVKYEGENGPPPMTALHSSCIGCHKAMKQGPVVCRDCHKQTFTGPHGIVEWDHTLHSRKLEMDTKQEFSDDCVVCHHQDTDARSEADYRACGTCHNPIVEKGLMTATGIKDHKPFKHGQCQDCHVEFNPENDNVACTSCHNGLVVNPATTNPSLEQAIHQRCGTCHNSEETKLDRQKPGICSDCHRPDPSRILVPELGTITWDHKRHGQFGGIDCQTCHHTDSADAPNLACSSCHGKNPEVELSLKESLDKTCLDCHKKENVGLTSLDSMLTNDVTAGYFKLESKEGTLWWNHTFHAVDASLSCRNCHHNTITVNGEYITADKTGKTWSEMAAHIQNCSNCHGPKGPVAGSVAQNTAAPKLEDAYKTVCITCHQKLAGGPQTWEAYFKPEPLVRQ
jgi:hypothetical protein